MAVVIAAIAWYEHRKSTESSEYGNNNQNEQLIAPAATSTTPTTTPAAASAAPKGSLAYTKMVVSAQYRIQFTDCHGIVNNTGNGTLAIRLGDKFMLDNRDNVKHVIAFKGQTWRLDPYGYAMATATTLGQYPITCDGGGAASLNVEK